MKNDGARMFEQAFKSIDDILWKEAGCTTELDYTEQSSRLLLLKYLDALEQDRAPEAELEGKRHEFIVDKAYRWESWAAPKGQGGQARSQPGQDPSSAPSPDIWQLFVGFQRYLYERALAA